MAVRAGRFQSNLGEMLHAFDEIMEQLPEARREALEAAGEALRKEVASQIDKRVNDSHGRVKRWQEVTVGSKYGYVKVAPAVERVEGKDCTSRKLTYWLEHGHGIAPLKRNRHGRIKQYEARRSDYETTKKKPYVKGRMFYSWSKMEAAKLARIAAEKALCVFEDQLDDLISE